MVEHWTYDLEDEPLPECINNVTTVAWYYDDIDDCDNSSATAIWNESVEAMNMVNLDTLG